MVMEKKFKSELKTDSNPAKVSAPSLLVMTSDEFSWKETKLFSSLTEQHGHSGPTHWDELSEQSRSGC